MLNEKYAPRAHGNFTADVEEDDGGYCEETQPVDFGTLLTTIGLASPTASDCG